MDRQRLLELAGIASNMGNPSQEPNSEIPSAGEGDVNGYSETGDDMDIMDQIKQEAMRGAEDPENACDCCQKILELLGDNGEEEMPDEEMM